MRPEVLRTWTGPCCSTGSGTWLAAVMDGSRGLGRGRRGGRGPVISRRRVGELVDAAWRQASARVVAVSDQVGSGIVPATSAGRLFRDQLGWLNQRLAAESDEAVLVVAGRVLSLPG